MLRFKNSLSNKVEEFQPISDNKKVGVYTCGPTVYDYVTIGNWRTYTLGDVVVRVLKYLGYDVDYIMNITDVGHLTGDNLGDADTGEDRMEKAAKREGRTAWEIAEFYTSDFQSRYQELNLTAPKVFAKATDHIEEQIKLVQQIEEAGFAYQITDGVYFDTDAYEDAGHTYGELSTLDQIREGARVEANPEKRGERDFALWKFSPAGEQRQMEWDSPWGIGFPGWHIECSAMSMKYLGHKFDVHVGGEDLRSTHHPNEIAQSEAATGERPFVKYWLHGAFLQVDGGRMGKSLGNAYTLQDLIDNGYDPMALKYFYYTGYYRKQINFTWEALEAAATGYKRLVKQLVDMEGSVGEINMDYKNKFIKKLEDDLNMPGAMAVVWELVKDDQVSTADRLATALDFDQVLGLQLQQHIADFAESEQDSGSVEVTPQMQELLDQRAEAREKKDWEESDRLRDELRELGVEVVDEEGGQKLVKA